MKTSKRTKYFRPGLMLAISLILWNPLQAGAFPQNGSGAGTGGGGMADGSSMRGVSGKVIETMNSGGYTYALVDTGSGKTWVALPQTEIAVGSEIACQPGMTMNNFNSTTLNRSFEHIVFTQGLASSASAVPSAPAEAITVSKAGGANARTIGEIFENKASLANTPVVVQAKVVKISRGIMGKNWLHLQDGTGSQAAKTNDLVVTTDSLPEIGEVVTITGNLSLDRDFGAGYRYGVIVENAEVAGNK